ncbi:calcium-binding protein [Streptomyces sp. NPDC127098]|uniref:calcium-binding protein n=1 Tax=Streptomyces sp. NPDC127098 TaxID=3347137 RepID=UPI0036554F5C
MRKVLVVLGAGMLAGAGLGASPASAATGATVYAVGNTAHYTAGGGQANDVAVTQVASADVGDQWLYVFNDVFPIDPGQGCFRPEEVDPTVVACHIADSGDIPYVGLDLGDGDDEAAVRTTGIGYVFGGTGDDTLHAASTGHEVQGGAGDDSLTGAYNQYGGSGNDTLLPSPGGWGYGGEGNDTLVGNAGDERLYGGPGNDVIYGQDGDDVAYGDAGEDEIHGGTGNDELHGGADDDLVFGNSGDDRLYGEGGTDELSGGAGNNVIRQD